jgi:hypothetical protein
MITPLPNGRGTVSGCPSYRARQQAAISLTESNFFTGSAFGVGAQVTSRQLTA